MEHVRRDRGPLVVLFVVLALFAADQIRLYRAMRSGQSRTDLERWMPIAAGFLSMPGAALYERHPDYLYPPWFLLLVYPFRFLPLSVAAFLAQTIKWAALLACIRWVFDLAAAPPRRLIAPAAAIGSLLCSLRFFINEMAELNVNMLILCAVIGAARLVCSGRAAWAGFVLALVCAVKVTPGLVVLYFLYKGQWRILMGVALGLLLTCVALPAAAVGLDDGIAALRGWYDHVISDFLSSGRVYSPHFNQSLTGWLNRLFTPAVAIEPDTPVTLVVLSPATLTALRAALAAGVLAVVIVAVRPRPGADRPPAMLAELGLVLIAMLLLSGYSWKAHYVALFPGYAAALASLFGDRPARRRRLIAALVVVSFVLCTLTCDLIGPRLADRAEAYGLIMFGAAGLATALIVIRAETFSRAPGTGRIKR